MRPDLAKEKVWRMGGLGYLAPVTFHTSVSQDLCPPGVDPVVIPLTGRIPGALFVARYDSTSTLSYSELGVAILARPGRGRTGVWVSQLWVDNPDSVEGGYENWGLVKKLARFEWNREGEEQSVAIRDEEGSLLTLRARVVRAGMSLPFKAGCFSFGPRGQILQWPVRSRSAVSRTKIGLDIPEGSFLSRFRLSRSYNGVGLDPLHVTIRVPGAGRTPEGTV